MSDTRGPVTLITSISDQRNRWKALAYAWKAVATQAIDGCTTCGAPALWRTTDAQRAWCESHWNAEDADPDAERTPWHVGLLRALDLEDGLAGGQP